MLSKTCALVETNINDCLNGTKLLLEMCNKLETTTHIHLGYIKILRQLCATQQTMNEFTCIKMYSKIQQKFENFLPQNKSHNQKIIKNNRKWPTKNKRHVGRL